jgi:ATP-dependent Clp protease ATP-binding subunit ClpA
LSEEASRWLVANGYDELMGARPMARVIQEHIKTPLADEVLFGKLKSGGHVRVVVERDDKGRDKLGFEFLEGPVRPKADKVPAKSLNKPRSPKRRAPPKPKGDGGKGDGGKDDGSGGGRGSVPKVPLVKA